MKKLTALIAVTLLATIFTACGEPEREIPDLDENLAKYNPAMIHVQIEEGELSQGWYYGDISEKKAGTPDDWLWTQNTEIPAESKWIAPVTAQ